MLNIEQFSSEYENSFENWKNSRGIEVALFDLDDTLIHTQKLFRTHEEELLRFCGNFIQDGEFEEFESRYSDINASSYAVMGASRKKWGYIADELSNIYGHTKFQDGLHIFDQIYLSAPELFEGAKDTLETFKKVGIRMGLVTHSSQEWTDLKVDQLGIRDYFEHIKSVDVETNKHKAACHWQEALDEFNVNPSHVIVIGDSLRSDIEAAHSIGVRNLALLPSGWHVFAQGEMPEGVIIVDKISNLIPTLLQSA